MSDEETVYDEATVQLVAHVVEWAKKWNYSGEQGAREALDALADAGLLLPPGGEVEWGWRRVSDGRIFTPYKAESANRRVLAIQEPGKYQLVRRPAIPWTEVTE